MNTKSFFLGAVVLFGLTLLGNAATTESKPLRYEVGERGANHRVVNKVVAQTNRLGAVSLSTNLAYVELAAGFTIRTRRGGSSIRRRSSRWCPAGRLHARGRTRSASPTTLRCHEMTA